MLKHVSSLLAAMALLTVPGASAQQTKLLTADKHNEYGLVYTLPRTALEITITATHTVAKAGPFWQYAKKYIGTDKVITADVDCWTIDAVAITPYGIPDPEQQYLMQLKPGSTTFICVDEDGMLRSINREITEPSQRPAASRPTRSDARIADMFSGKEYLQYVTEDFLASQSAAKQAQMLAQSLMEVREAKIDLTRGTADNMPTDGRQLELMLNSLGDQEATMTRAFLGWESSETVTRTFTFIPDEPGRHILFRMSDFAGMVEADDLSGDPVYINVRVLSQPELPKDDKGVEKKLPKDAVMYAIPGTAGISIVLNGKTLISKDLEVAQYGELFGLNPNLFTDKKAPSYAIFNPVTGGIEKIATRN